MRREEKGGFDATPFQEAIKTARGEGGGALTEALQIYERLSQGAPNTVWVPLAALAAVHHLAARIDESSQALDRGLLASYSTPSQHAARREQGVLLARALGRLPEDYREVIILRHLESLPFAGVAQRMGRSENGVQKLWVRALAHLRRLLEETS